MHCVREKNSRYEMNVYRGMGKMGEMYDMSENEHS